MKKVKNFLSKNKILGVIGLTSLFASSAQAAVTFNETSGFGGSVEMLFFYSAVGVVVGAVTVVWAIKKAIAMFR
ncbi:putative membrane protein [Campylobacter sp. RM5004]|uniref:hypothetical protein n=1 Tax=Campylobacter sp. RM5004 TaxID=1660078 RepID=UPI001EFA8326|nr:hypothetical protein [Campylobacter sp. RM5004]ULO01294.1 putative membrane protein [Campylobacter sp. RM5004]